MLSLHVPSLTLAPCGQSPTEPCLCVALDPSPREASPGFSREPPAPHQDVSGGDTLDCEPRKARVVGRGRTRTAAQTSPSPTHPLRRCPVCAAHGPFLPRAEGSAQPTGHAKGASGRAHKHPGRAALTRVCLTYGTGGLSAHSCGLHVAGRRPTHNEENEVSTQSSRLSWAAPGRAPTGLVTSASLGLSPRQRSLIRPFIP